MPDLYTFGEAMALFLSEDTDSVIDAKLYRRSTSGAEGNVAVAIPVRVTDPLLVVATPTGFVVNERIGPLRSSVVCFILLYFSIFNRIRLYRIFKRFFIYGFSMEFVRIYLELVIRKYPNS